MATSPSTIGYARQRVSAVKPARRIRKEKVKKTFRQRIREWLFEEKQSAEDYIDQGISISEDRFNSDGMRLQVYKGSGGFVVEVRTWDRKRDENNNKMYIIHEDKDLGAELGKIITMESMR